MLQTKVTLTEVPDQMPTAWRVPDFRSDFTDYVCRASFSLEASREAQGLDGEEEVPS